MNDKEVNYITAYIAMMITFIIKTILKPFVYIFAAIHFVYTKLKLLYWRLK